MSYFNPLFRPDAPSIFSPSRMEEEQSFFAEIGVKWDSYNRRSALLFWVLPVVSLILLFIYPEQEMRQPHISITILMFPAIINYMVVNELKDKYSPNGKKTKKGVEETPLTQA